MRKKKGPAFAGPFVFTEHCLLILLGTEYRALGTRY